MRITHDGPLSIIELGAQELGSAIRAYVRDHLPTEEYDALAPPDMRPLRYASVHVSGQPLDACSVRVVARRRQEVDDAVPATSASLRDRQICALSRAGRIPAEDAVVALGIRPADPAELDACRARVASAWNELLDGGLVCSIVWRPSDSSPLPGGLPWGRAVVVVHGRPPRDAHGTADTRDRVRATEQAARWAVRNGLVELRDDPPVV